ncbi:AMSH-like ubiquitin thioesterase 3 [Acorus calamus]|uniref:AMSH-like ubiquitin thioesterase 3 n=1 Tax=Acorus calamus TaxID=4465 RepID=A0AAV9CUQ5_ACOCL|nr:AMSH-like ubiquitin thioesterase 3 [Acorus calamus]
MGPSVRAIDINACAPRIEVDNRLSLRYYYRIAQNLLYQANVYREEKNLLDLYVILLRFSSLMCDTIPYHRDYQIMFPKEKAIFKKVRPFALIVPSLTLKECGGGFVIDESEVQYPTDSDLAQTEISGLNQDGQNGFAMVKDDNSNVGASEMESVLSLDDGRWLRPLEESCSLSAEAARDESFQLSLIRQPAPPPVLAQVQELPPISPSKVADPRPGPARPLDNALPDSKSYQKLHIKSRMFYVTTLVIPKQEATSDSCQTMNEEEIFDAQDTRSLIPLGWIHTHPSQTCFMSSIDLHTHYSYQIMLPEAIAIVMAPTDTSRNHGIFHLSDPGGVSVIRNCQQRGFHPHEEPPDGSPLYEHCSHVYMNHNFEVEVLDLR